jgi:hypothetical protein
MGTTLKTSSLAAARFVGLLANSASTQDVVEARIPFSFVVGSQEFPAGRYQFTNSHRVLTLRGTGQRCWHVRHDKPRRRPRSSRR